MLREVLETAQVFDFMPGVGIALAVFAGAWVGSFLNVVVHRLPRMVSDSPMPEETSGMELADSSERVPYNLAWPGSHCPACRAPVRARHNIPVFGWLWLRGRCADCQAPIPLRYPLLELGAAIACGLAVVFFGLTLAGLAASVLLCSLLALAVLDLEHWWLPDVIVLPLVWAGLLINSIGLLASLESAVWGAVIGYGLLRLLATVWGRFRETEALGLGDCKLAAAIGAWLGWPGLAATLMLAGFGTAFAGLFAGRRAKDPLPFGPGLAAASAVVLFLQPEGLLGPGGLFG